MSGTVRYCLCLLAAATAGTVLGQERAAAPPGRLPDPSRRYAWKPALAWVDGRAKQFASHLEKAHAALVARARSEDAALLAQLSPTPPRPRPRGYQRLPEVRPDIEQASVQRYCRRYSLERLTTEFVVDLRDAALLAARSASEAGVPLPPMVERFVLLRRRLRFMEELVAYHRYWQRAVITSAEYFADRNRIVKLATELHALERKGGDRAKAAALRREIESRIAPFRATPGLAIESSASGAHVLPVTLVTDIQDTAFLAAFKKAAHDAFAKPPACTACRFRVSLEFRRLAPASLYPEGVPKRGAMIDEKRHLARFPTGSLVLTTGARSTHAMVGRYIQLGADPLRRRALAHEFSHLLGFSDGYLRGFEGDPASRFGCVLVEWGGLVDNLMGSPDRGRVSESMIRQLMDAYGRR